MYVFTCEDSLEGILTGVYDAFDSKLGHRNIRLATGAPENYELFSEYISVAPSPEKTEKVVNTILSRFGRPFYESIFQAAVSEDSSGKKKPDKAQAIYGTILLAMSYDKSQQAEQRAGQAAWQGVRQTAGQNARKSAGQNAGQLALMSLGNPCVCRVFELCRAASREACHHLEFLRFSELENGVLFAVIHPKSGVLPYVAAHFSDRLPCENFMIYDATHSLAAVHMASKPYVLVGAEQLDMDKIKRHSAKEQECRKLWTEFFDHITVEARRNPALQMQLMPKRYWQDMPELSQPISGNVG